MIVQVAPTNPDTRQPHPTLRYHYNAPADIHVGELLDLPTLAGGRFVGKVTQIGARAAASLRAGQYSGPISPIIGRHQDLHVEVTAKSKSDLRRQLEDLIDDLEDDLYNGEGF